MYPNQNNGFYFYLSLSWVFCAFLFFLFFYVLFRAQYLASLLILLYYKMLHGKQKRKLIIVCMCILISVTVFITLIVLLFLTSLYKTIPANIPYFTSIPYYRNQWKYTPSLHLSQPNPHLNAAYITFAHGDKESLSNLRQTMRTIEDMFNRHHNYPYIIFTNDDLSTEYKELVASVTQGDVWFEKVTENDYGYANTTDQFRASLARDDLKGTEGNTEEFRFKSRLMAGTIFK